MKAEFSLNHTRWDCKYHVVWIPKYRKKVLYEKLRTKLGEVFHELAEQKESKIQVFQIRNNSNTYKYGNHPKEKIQFINRVKLENPNLNHRPQRSGVLLKRVKKHHQNPY